MSLTWTVKHNFLDNLLDSHRQGGDGAIHQGLARFLEEHSKAGHYCIHCDSQTVGELEVR